MGGVKSSETLTRLPSRRMVGVMVAGVTAAAVSATGALVAQDPVVRAHLEPAEVEVGETFRLYIEVSGVREVEDVALPTGRYGLWFAGTPREGTLPVATETAATEGARSGGGGHLLACVCGEVGGGRTWLVPFR